jgi:hypothetical protein
MIMDEMELTWNEANRAANNRDNRRLLVEASCSSMRLKKKIE